MPALPHSNLDAQKRSARGLVEEMVAGDLSTEVPYQRESVWTIDQRVALIESFLRGVPLPALILNNRNSLDWKRANGERASGAPVSVVIDGKQRLETLRLWFGGELAVPSHWFHPDEIGDLTQAARNGTVCYTDLTTSTQRHLALSIITIPVAEANVATVEEEAGVYLLVNSAGTSQTVADLARAARVAAGGSAA